MGNFSRNIVSLSGKKLPSDYTKLSYVESNGNQYLSLNINCSNYTEIYAEFQYTELGDCIVGTLSSTTFQYISVYNGQYEIGAGNKQFHAGSATLQKNTMKCVYNNGTLVAFLNGESILSDTYTFGANKTKLYVFGVDYNGGVAWRSKLRLYKLKIKNTEDNVSINLIPCKRNTDNKVGMYDLENGFFYVSQTSTDLIAGE